MALKTFLNCGIAAAIAFILLLSFAGVHRWHAHKQPTCTWVMSDIKPGEYPCVPSPSR